MQQLDNNQIKSYYFSQLVRLPQDVQVPGSDMRRGRDGGVGAFPHRDVPAPPRLQATAGGRPPRWHWQRPRQGPGLRGGLDWGERPAHTQPGLKILCQCFSKIFDIL